MWSENILVGQKPLIKNNEVENGGFFNLVTISSVLMGIAIMVVVFKIPEGVT